MIPASLRFHHLPRTSSLSTGGVVDDSAVDDPDDSVAPAGDLGVVGADEEAGLFLGRNFPHEVDQLHGCFAVEVAGGFVGENQSRVVDESSRHGYTLFLAAGESRGPETCPVTQTDAVEQIFGVALRGPGLAAFGNPRGEQHVLERGEVRHEVVELKDEAEGAIAEGGELSFRQADDLLASDRDGSGSRPQQRTEDRK